MGIRWRYIGLAVALVVEMITVSDLSWRPLSIFAFGAVGLVAGDLSERIWRGQLGTAKWSFSLRTLLILTILGPLALAWAYFEWQAPPKREQPIAPDMVRTLEEILNDENGSPTD